MGVGPAPVRGDTMDTALATTLEPKRRAENPFLSADEPGQDGPTDYVGRHVRDDVPEADDDQDSHPRGHGFRIISRLARRPA